MTFLSEVLQNILAVDKAFTEYEFIHTYLGPKELEKDAAGIAVDDAEAFLRQALIRVSQEVADTFPHYRKTYSTNLLQSVLAQLDIFVHHRPCDIRGAVETFMAMQLPPPFAIDAELQQLVDFVNRQGFSSIRDFKSKKRELRFPDFAALHEHLSHLLADFTALTLQRYQPLFTLPLDVIAQQSRVTIEPAQEIHPCYYRYDGHYQGVVGLQAKDRYTEAYLKNFLFHEVIPGHHWYYLIKQHLLDTQEEDALSGLDTYYSPENVINEGLAMNADIIFGALLEPDIVISLRLEKFLHKILYNGWYFTHILHEEAPSAYRRVMQEEIGMSAAGIENKWNYYVHEQKYYIPCYPAGVCAVAQFLDKFTMRALPHLYNQHSIATLAQLERQLSAGVPPDAEIR